MKKQSIRYYYTTPFDETDMPCIERVNYNGYKWGDVIDPHAARTFREATAQHRRNLKRMVELCKIELDRIPDMTPETIRQSDIW